MPPAAALSAVGVVLIAEDFDDTREMYSYFLSMRGWRVVEAANGRDVLPLVEAHSPDVIVMDLSMPGIDGWELTQRLKADEASAHVPIIVLTGHVLPAERARAEAMGCDSFLSKPCLPVTLERELERFVTRKRDA
jgi:CheY-like chemotaxis protein